MNDMILELRHDILRTHGKKIQHGQEPNDKRNLKFGRSNSKCTIQLDPIANDDDLEQLKDSQELTRKDIEDAFAGFKQKYQDDTEGWIGWIGWIGWTLRVVAAENETGR